MSTFIGYNSPFPVGLTDSDRLTVQIDSLEYISFDGEMVIVDSPIQSSVSSYGTIVENETNLAGYLIPSFFELFYNRIHIIPNFIDFGDLASNQLREVRVWNAYLDSDKDLENLIESGDLTGFDYDDITVPQTFLALEEKVFLVEISASGSPTFDGALTFDFETGVDDPKLTIIGRRVIIFPFMPNWSTLPQERLFYLTKIQSAEQATEKRIKFRDIPRRNLLFEYAVNSKELDFESTSRARNHLEALLMAWTHRLFVIGIDLDSQQLREESSFGSTLVENISTIGLDYEENGYVLFYQNWENYELVEIDSFTEDTIELKKPLSRNWEMGLTKIMPARNAKMILPVSVQEYNLAVDSATIEWALEAPYTSSNRRSVFTTPIYKSSPVFLLKSDESGDTTREYDRKIRILDKEVGQRTYSGPGIFGITRFSMNLLLENREMFSQFLDWLNTLSGRQKTAWFPTWAKDFFLSSPSPINSQYLVVKGQKMSSLLSTGTNRRYILIEYLNGDLFYTKIESAIGSSIEDIETLFIEDGLDQLTSTDTVKRISFLRLARYDSDIFSFEWQTDDKVLTSSRLVEVAAI